RQIRRFRMLSRAYGAPNVSWWDWQEGTPGAFHAISQTLGGLPGYQPDRSLATGSLHAQGDLVIWAQQHLLSTGQRIAGDGDFGRATLGAVKRFQASHGLGADGIIGPITWGALLRYRTARVHWVISHRRQVAVIARDGAHIEAVPRSAGLRAKGYEIPRS